MAINPKPGEVYTIRRKILTVLGAKFHVYDENAQVIAFCKQKAFKLKEDIRLYTDESMGEELFALKARQVIDFGATYDVTLPGGEALGSFRRKGMKSSFVRDEWQVLDSEGKLVATMKEVGTWAPLVRRYVDNAAAFMPARYTMDRAGDGLQIAVFRQHFNLFVYRLGISVTGGDEVLDDLMILAAGSLIAAIEGRQG